MPRLAVLQAQAAPAQAAKAANVRATPRPAVAVPHAQALNMFARKTHPLHIPLQRASTEVAEATAQAVPTTEATHQAAAITEAVRLREVPLQVRDVVQAAATVAEAAAQAQVQESAAAVQVAVAVTVPLVVAVAQVVEEDNLRATSID